MSQLAPAPIGIDLGTYKSKIAVAKRGGVEVITNEANFRETPCVVGYGKEQRHIGESGNIKMKSNFKDTIVAPMRFLGLDTEYPLLRAETKFSPARANTNDGRLKFDVNYQGEKQTLLPEQAMAAYFNKLKLTIEKNGFESKEVILSVPTYLTQTQRKAYFDAARIAELNIVRLVNDSTAVALDYGLFRKGQLDAQKPRNVLFIDFGHSKLGVFACSFTKTQMNVLEQEFCRNVGCRDIDYHLYEFYRNVFEKSSGGLDLSESKKAYVKLMENIQKQRKVLSGNLEHDLNIEYLMEENDLNYTMRREEFEKVSEPIFNEIKRVLVKIREELKARDIPLHSIELVGGGSRIPLFLQTVRQVYGVEPSRTLNSSQSVARGCALEAAIKSPLFRVQDYILNERVYNGVKFCWNFVQGNNYLGLDADKYPEAQCKMIYDFGAKVPSSKTIKFKRKEPIEILIEYEPAVNGFRKHIGYYKTPAQNPKHETFGVSFKIKFNEHGLVTFEDCNLIEQWTEETKVPKKKETPKDQKKEEKKESEKKEGENTQDKEVEQKPQPIEEEQFQIKKTKKEKYYPIKFDANEFNLNSEQDLQKFFTLESQMLNKDRLILQTYERKNQLQSLSYKWKENLNGSYREFAKPEDIPGIIKMLEEYSQWLYGDGHDASRGAYKERIEKVNTKIIPIKNRHDNFFALSEEIKRLFSSLEKNFHFLNSTDKKYEHISAEDRDPSYKLIENTRAWMQHLEDQQAKKAKWEEPVVTVSEIAKKIKEVDDHCRKTMSKPVPKPAEPKKEDKPEKMEAEDNEKKQQDAGKPSGETQPQTDKPEKMETE